MRFSVSVVFDAEDEDEARRIRQSLVMSSLAHRFKFAVREPVKEDGPGEVPSIIAYTDGGAISHGERPGGWGVVIREPGKDDRELFGGERGTTNNRMELMAACEALEALDDGSTVMVVTDSRYVRDGITSWIKQWVLHDWHTLEGKPVKNKDLWVRLLKAQEKHTVDFKWVKGHNGHAGNEKADALALRGRQSVA